MAQRFRSEKMAAVHETAAGLHEAGLIDETTMHAFEEMCLIPVESVSPAQIDDAGDEEDSPS